MRTIQNIRAEIAQIEKVIDALNFDENGNALDRQAADAAFTKLDALNVELFGENAPQIMG